MTDPEKPPEASPHHPHKPHGAPDARARLRVFVMTISDTRTEENDEGGRLCRQLLEEADHEVIGYVLVRDEPEVVAARVRSVAAEGHADALISTGGTGVSRRDSTFEALSALLHKRIDGFGELFRMLSYQEVGARAMLSRATAGLVLGPRSAMPVLALPGSVAAVRLGMTKLILPVLPHLCAEARR